MQLSELTPNIFTISDFWSQNECLEAIAKSEKIGYNAASIGTDKGQRIVESVRNNNRVMLYDTALATKLWERLKPFAPSKIGNSVAIGLNELFRFYKYQSNEQFKKHRDQSFIRNESEASYFTFMIYLNDEYEGGETTFNEVTILPEQGMALIFLHDLEHEGSTVTSGTKYVLRTDIMYKLP